MGVGEEEEEGEAGEEGVVAEEEDAGLAEVMKGAARTSVEEGSVEKVSGRVVVGGV